MTSSPRTAASRRPSSATIATSVFEFPPSTARTVLTPARPPARRWRRPRARPSMSGQQPALGSASSTGAGGRPLHHRARSSPVSSASPCRAPGCSAASRSPPRPRTPRDSQAASIPARTPRIVGPRPERAAEPRSGVDAGGRDDRPLRRADVGAESRRGQKRHPGMVEGVVPDQMAAIPDRPRELRICLGPPSLDEEARRHALRIERVEHPFRAADAVGPVWMFRVERQRDTERHRGRGASPAAAA